jgi:hypothetical protein
MITHTIFSRSSQVRAKGLADSPKAQSKSIANGITLRQAASTMSGHVLGVGGTGVLNFKANTAE